jgi:hypothetical protein
MQAAVSHAMLSVLAFIARDPPICAPFGTGRWSPFLYRTVYLSRRRAGAWAGRLGLARADRQAVRLLSPAGRAADRRPQPVTPAGGALAWMRTLGLKVVGGPAGIRPMAGGVADQGGGAGGNTKSAGGARSARGGGEAPWQARRAVPTLGSCASMRVAARRGG